MKARDVRMGATYLVKVSGKICPVKLIGGGPKADWIGRNETTGREVYIRTAGRLRSEVKPDAPPAPKVQTLWAAFHAFKAEDPDRILIFEGDTTARPTLLVFNGDVAAIEAAGWPIPDTEKLAGHAATVATLPHDRLDDVLAAIVASGRRAAVLRRAVSSEAVRSEIRRVVTPGSLMEVEVES